MGDIVVISNRGKSQYLIIAGTDEYDEKSKKYPRYFGMKFGSSVNGKFSGYHTKAFQNKIRITPYSDLWFEGMEYLWDVSKINKERLEGPKLKAYEAAMKDIKWREKEYNRSQIKYIFNYRRN